MDLWKALTAISGILIVLIAVFLVWNFVVNPRIVPKQVEKTTEIISEGQTSQYSLSFGENISCLEEAKANGAPVNFLNYYCSIEYWAEPYYRGARIQDAVQDNKMGAIYHHICRCTFTYLE